MFPQTVGQRDYVFHCLGARRDSSITAETELVEILYFQHFYEHMTFGETDWSHRGKCLQRYIRVAVAVDLDAVTAKPEEKTSE